MKIIFLPIFSIHCYFLIHCVFDTCYFHLILYVFVCFNREMFTKKSVIEPIRVTIISRVSAKKVTVEVLSEIGHNLRVTIDR